MLRRTAIYRCVAPVFSAILMPALSPTMEQATLLEWQIDVGSKIETGTNICLIQTDKATVAFENQLEEGYLAKKVANVGDIISVMGVIGVMVEEKEHIDRVEEFVIPSATQPTPATSPSTEVSATPVPANINNNNNNNEPYVLHGGTLEQAIKDSGPSISRIVQSIGGPAMLKGVTPTGKNGRFLKSDVIHLDIPHSDGPVAGNKSIYSNSNNNSNTGSEVSQYTNVRGNVQPNVSQDYMDMGVVRPGAVYDFSVSDKAILARLFAKRNVI